MHSQLRQLRISPLSGLPTGVFNKNSQQPSTPSTSNEHRTHLPKRISLPENLTLKPQMLLNLKQSMQVEQQLVGMNKKSENIFKKSSQIRQTNSRI